jgi:hypothetical protein
VVKARLSHKIPIILLNHLITIKVVVYPISGDSVETHSFVVVDKVTITMSQVDIRLGEQPQII